MPNKSIQITDDLNSPPKWAAYAFLAAVGFFLFLVLFKLPATPFFGDADQSIFLYEAERMFNGDVIYRDFFEFTLPGTQAFYALIFSIFGVHYWIVSVTILIIGVITALLLLQISKHILPSPLCFLPATIYIFFGFRWVGLDGSHRSFSPVFVLLAVWLLLKGKGLRNLAVTGCSLAAASFFTQQRGLVVLAAFITFLFVDKLFNQEKWTAFIKSTAVISLSFAATLAAMCVYFVVAAGPENFFYATVIYPYKYYSDGHPNHFGVYFDEMTRVFAITKIKDIFDLAKVLFYSLALPFVNLALLLIFLEKRKNVDWTIWRGPVLIAMTGLFLTLSTTAPVMARLFPISGFALIMLVWLFYKFGPSWEVKRRFAYASVATLMFFGLFMAIRMQTNWEVAYLDSPAGKLAIVVSPQSERYQWLLEHTKPGEYFYEVYEPMAYFPLRLKNPTRFGQIWPSEYTRPEQVAEAVRDLGQKPPKYILWDNGYLNPDRLPGDHTGPLADFVRMRYSPIGDIYEMDGKSIQIWEIKTQ